MVSPHACLLPELPFWREEADYVMGSGLCKDVAGPGGTGEQSSPQPPADVSGAEPGPCSHRSGLPGPESRSQGWGSNGEGEVLAWNETALAGLRNASLGPSFLRNQTNPFSSQASVSLPEKLRRGGFGNL